MNMNMRIDHNHTYQTSDLACAAALSLYFPLEHVDKTDPRRAYFIFARTTKLDATLDEYQKQTLRVKPRAYFDQVKALKTRLYNIN
jgi:Domain of unknown function (DUF5659)